MPTMTPLLRMTLGLVLAALSMSGDAYAPPPASPRWSSLRASTASVDGTSSSTAVESRGAAHAEEAEEDNITTRDLLSLDYIRSTLIRQEETIIFALIERAQFRQNDVCYELGGVPGLGTPPGSVAANGGEEEELSFLDFMLTGTVSCK